MNRRDFLKRSAVTTGAVVGGVALANTVKPLEVSAASIGTKVHTGKTIYDLVETNDEMVPFNITDTIFHRSGIWGFDHPEPVPPTFFMTMMSPKEHDNLGDGILDFALQQAAGINWGDKKQHYFLRPGHPNTVDGKPKTFKSAKEASYYVKAAAKLFKASDVGICKYDENWMYAENIAEFKELGFKPKSVIVMPIMMNHEILRLYPRPAGLAGAALGYSNMAEVSSKVAQFISLLGYTSHSAGNDWGISVPLAVSAGLGEGSRMGTLIHPELGSGFRLCKVFTELELEPDAPITFGVENFCMTCKKCADNCPGDAIFDGPKSYADGSNVSSRLGVKKWGTNSVKCFEYWGESHADCGRCITSCPYFKYDNWVHRFAKIAVVTPGLQNVARYVDDLFGYGKMPTDDLYHEVWDRLYNMQPEKL